MTVDNGKQHKDNDLPPFVKSWKQFYGLLVLWLVILIIAFYLFTIFFR